jgi:hypothetical protein
MAYNMNIYKVNFGALNISPNPIVSIDSEIAINVIELLLIVNVYSGFASMLGVYFDMKYINSL